MRKEYRFPFKAQVFAETLTGLGLDGILINIGKRHVLGHTVYAMVAAVDPKTTMDEVYDLMDAALETEGNIDSITEAVIEELMISLGNPRADVNLYIKALKVEDAEKKRTIKAKMAETIKAAKLLEEESPPPGPGETPKN